MEERTEDQDYYWILEKAGLPYPEKIDNPEDIDCLVIVKLHHAQKKLEARVLHLRFLQRIPREIRCLLAEGVIDQASLDRSLN